MTRKQVQATPVIRGPLEKAELNLRSARHQEEYYWNDLLSKVSGIAKDLRSEAERIGRLVANAEAERERPGAIVSQVQHQILWMVPNLGMDYLPNIASDYIRSVEGRKVAEKALAEMVIAETLDLS